MRVVETGGWEDCGHGQGVSCTEKRDDENQLTCPIALPLLGVPPPSDGMEEERWRGVSTTDEKTYIIKRTPLTIQGQPVLIVGDYCDTADR